MPRLTDLILSEIARERYQPLKPKSLSRKLGIPADRYAEFKQALNELLAQKRLEIGKNRTVQPVVPHGTVTGTYRSTSGGFGFVRPQPVINQPGADIFIRAGHGLDAATGDLVLVRITRRPHRRDLGPSGEVIRVLERATRQFVGTYFERQGDGLVRVDGTVFAHSIGVGDAGAKGGRPGDKVVIEMIRFPSPEDRGEAVITEVLGPQGKPGVDALSIIREFGLPDEFPEEVLAEARQVSGQFSEKDLDGREDFTSDLVVTIDPVDARDFDDAVSLLQDPHTRHWVLAVHIADVSHFAPAGGALDREARKRATSVYLPRRVLPMFPEVISNGVASLQQGKVRYAVSALMDFTPEGKRTSVRLARSAICVRKRLTYEQVQEMLDAPKKRAPGVRPEVKETLLEMQNFAAILRRRRSARGALELELPEAELDYNREGRVVGAHSRSHGTSHQLIEEFMLAANEAVAEQLYSISVPFLRRVHPPPDPIKLENFAEFARLLGYNIHDDADRFALQNVLRNSANRREGRAIHYALLRSMKQAVYSPEDSGHYALASEYYCHFTSPIRRYPDLTVHRLVSRWLRSGRAATDREELVVLGDHCSKMERRAEAAERELVKVKLLQFLSDKVGTQMDAIVTGVADYGFFAMGLKIPVEGRVHSSTLTDDVYRLDQTAQALVGRSSRNRFRLGDPVRVEVVRVDAQRRQLDFRAVRPARVPVRRLKRH
jgi:ribonuclease R